MSRDGTAAAPAALPGSGSRIVEVLREGLSAVWSAEGGRLPTLDAARALAVVLVICTHWPTRFYKNGGVDVGLHRLPISYYGWSGVDLFFILSGYLIGGQLWKELAKTGSVDFPRFFLRRAFRIWPYYFAFCGVVLAFLPIGEHRLRLSDLLFYSNYVHGGIAGGWSLATEEQFYIVAPLLVIALGRRIPLKGYFAVLGLAEAAAVVARYRAHAALAARHGDVQELHNQFHLHADGLLIGMAIALAFTLRPEWLKRDDLSLRGWGVALGLTAVAAAGYAWNQRAFNFAALALIYGGLVIGLLLDRTIVSRLCRFRGFHAISVLSFGMYLNHFILVELVPESWIPLAEPLGPHVSYFGGLALLVLLSALVATASYVLIEHPFLVWRDKILADMAKRKAAAQAA